MLRLTIEELAVEVIGASTVVKKSREQHDHKHAFVDAHVRFGAHKTEIERGEQRPGSLSRFFFEVRERRRLHPGPLNWAIFADAGDADTDAVAVASDRTLRDAARFVICVEPAPE